jgi:ubiquinone/menaquinone biosynthesis C-methylase UbiE
MEIAPERCFFLKMSDDRLQTEIEAFDDTQAYLELMARPYTRRLKAEVDKYMASQNLKGATILELGCGISEHANRFNRDNLMVVTDITKSLVEKNDPPSIRAICDAQVLPFKDKTVDFIIYVGILHHLPDQVLSLNEAARVSRPNGRIFICEPHRRSINYVYYNLRLITMRVLGVRFVKKLIGCFSPDESQLNVKAVENIFNGDFAKKKWTILSFRLPPLRLFKDSKLDVVFSNFFDRLPIFKHIGTTVFYDIRRLK